MVVNHKLVHYNHWQSKHRVESQASATDADPHSDKSQKARAEAHRRLFETMLF